MTMILEVKKRDGKADADAIAAVVYGPKQESIALTLNKIVFEKLFKEAGESSIITLEGLDEPIEVLVHEVTFNPVKGGIQHVDFYAIERGKELTTNIPLEYTGEAPAEKLGGVLVKSLHEIEVTCRPSVLPKNIVVDVSVLKDFESQIHVSDLVVPEGVKIENAPEEPVAAVVPVEEEAEVEEAPAVDMGAIEVEKKGKEEGEGKTEKE